MRVHWNYHAGRVSHEHKVFAVYIHRVWSWWLLVFKDIERGETCRLCQPKQWCVSSYLGQIILDKLFNFRVTMRQRKFRKGFVIIIES